MGVRDLNSVDGKGILRVVLKGGDKVDSIGVAWCVPGAFDANERTFGK